MALCSFVFGFSGGLLIVPLNATIQYFAPEKISGKIMAGNNFLQNVFMVVFLLLSIVFVQLNVSTEGLFLVTSAVCLLQVYIPCRKCPLFTRLFLLLR